MNFANMQILDIILILVILLFTIMGLIKGFIDMLFNRAAPVLSIWGALLFYRTGVQYLSPYIKQELVCQIASFALIFIVLFLVVKIIQLILGKFFNTILLKQLNNVLGLVFGIVEGCTVVILVLLIMTAQPWIDFTEMLNSSHIYKFFEPLVTKLPDLFLNAVSK